MNVNHLPDEERELVDRLDAHGTQSHPVRTTVRKILPTILEHTRRLRAEKQYYRDKANYFQSQANGIYEWGFIKRLRYAFGLFEIDRWGPPVDIERRIADEVVNDIARNITSEREFGRVPIFARPEPEKEVG